MANNKPSKSNKKAAGSSDGQEGHKLIAKNRRALHDFAIDHRLEAGLVLTGTEVKACRAGKAQIHEAFVQVIRGEAFLLNAHIDEYSHGNRFNHEPTRSRKLLLHYREIYKLAEELHEGNIAAVPLSLYFKGGRVKVEIGVGRGQRKADRRERVKERETDRELQRIMRRSKA